MDEQQISLSLSCKGDSEEVPNRIISFRRHEKVLIGRSSRSNDPKLTPRQSNAMFTSPVISRKHAEIYLGGSSVMIRDLQSMHGTYLNGTQLKAHVPHSIHDGDTIKVGKSFDGDKMTARTLVVQYGWEPVVSLNSSVIDLTDPKADKGIVYTEQIGRRITAPSNSDSDSASSCCEIVGQKPRPTVNMEAAAGSSQEKPFMVDDDDDHSKAPRSLIDAESAVPPPLPARPNQIESKRAGDNAESALSYQPSVPGSWASAVNTDFPADVPTGFLHLANRPAPVFVDELEGVAPPAIVRDRYSPAHMHRIDSEPLGATISIPEPANDSDILESDPDGEDSSDDDDYDDDHSDASSLASKSPEHNVEEGEDYIEGYPGDLALDDGLHMGHDDNTNVKGKPHNQAEWQSSLLGEQLGSPLKFVKPQVYQSVSDEPGYQPHIIYADPIRGVPVSPFYDPVRDLATERQSPAMRSCHHIHHGARMTPIMFPDHFDSTSLWAAEKGLTEYAASMRPITPKSPRDVKNTLTLLNTGNTLTHHTPKGEQRGTKRKAMTDAPSIKSNYTEPKTSTAEVFPSLMPTPDTSDAGSEPRTPKRVKAEVSPSGTSATKAFMLGTLVGSVGILGALIGLPEYLF